MLYLGRGTAYPLALEGALKLKEISYIHAEGYAASRCRFGNRIQALFVESEAGVGTDPCRHVGGIRDIPSEPLVLCDPLLASSNSVSVGHLVAENAPDPGSGHLLAQHGQRSLNAGG